MVIATKHAIKSRLCPGPDMAARAVAEALDDGVNVRDIIVNFCGAVQPSVAVPGATGAVPLFLVMWEAPQGLTG